MQLINFKHITTTGDIAISRSSWYDDSDLIDDSEFAEGGDTMFVESGKCIAEISDILAKQRTPSNLNMLASIAESVGSETTESYPNCESDSEIVDIGCEYEGGESGCEIDSDSDSDMAECGSDYEDDAESEPDELKDDADFARYVEL